ncbi:MAG: carbon storage regulator CsrA [Planctomycetota bacterium]|nr:MAG: carbon storage regulator CsrA [Planctomycetota bacterium]
MLVLSRHKDETIMIGDSIEITVVEVRGDRVKIGIRAPMAIPVHRKEVYLSIKAENLAAVEIDAEALAAAGELLAGGKREEGS